MSDVGHILPIKLTEEQIDDIAERAADKAVEKMQTQIFAAVGKGVITRLFYLIGIGVVALWAWAKSKGIIG